MNAIAVLLVCFYLLGYSGVSHATDALCSDSSTTISASLRLRRKLFCDYDVNVRPVKNHGNTTDLTVLLWLRFMRFHEDWNALDVHSWTVWEWKDEHLTWKRDDYDQLENLKVSSSEIWIPDISLYTGADQGDVSHRVTESSCHLDYNGTVLCVAPTVYSGLCNADITRWPFDSHNCTFRLGSWLHTGSQINLTLRDKGIGTTEYSPNRDWELLSSSAFAHRNIYAQIENESYPWVSFNFNLKRHSGGHAATVFIPSLVLATLTLCIFWMESRSVDRMCLISLNILCHCLYLQYLGANLPSNGDKYPVILLFYRDSLLLASVSLIVTLVVRRMDAASSPPPVWITTLTDAVLATMPGRIFLSGDVDGNKHSSGGDDVTGLVETSRKDSRWHLFAVLLDRTFFLIFFLTFIILLCGFVP